MALEPRPKIILFTAFLEQLELLKLLCQSKRWKVVIYSGKLTQTQKDTAIQKWQDNEDTPILLMSVRAGSTGLNLTAASKVLLVDLWRNTSTEHQAFSRALEVVRLVCNGSYDVEMLKLQGKKDVAINSVMSDRRAKAYAGVHSFLDLLHMNVSTSEMQDLLDDFEVTVKTVEEDHEDVEDAAAAQEEASLVVGAEEEESSTEEEVSGAKKGKPETEEEKSGTEKDESVVDEGTEHGEESADESEE